MRRLGRFLRTLADRCDPDGAPRYTGLVYGYVEHVGLVVGWSFGQGVGTPLLAYTDDPDHALRAWHPDVERRLLTPVPTLPTS